MSVITISRGTHSGGKTLAECLAVKLDYRCVDREAIVQRAAASGVPEEELHEALEKPPGFLERFGHRRYKYLAIVQAALAEEVRRGRVIYHGLAGHLLLGGGRHILRTRIIAPVSYRVRMVCRTLHYNETQARAYIESMDDERRRWTAWLYGVDWGDPALYDVVLNLEHMTIETACHIISAAARRRCFEMTPACRRALEDLAVASRVRANLAMAPPTEGLELEVTAADGVVAIRGKLASTEQSVDVEQIAKAVPRVTALHLDQLAPPIQV